MVFTLESAFVTEPEVLFDVPYPDDAYSDVFGVAFVFKYEELVVKGELKVSFWFALSLCCVEDDEDVQE